MFDVFGEMNTALKFFIAFAIVLSLIALTAWLVRRFAAARLGGATRGRQPRLAVIDAASVDGRRRLILIRRDNVEHLLMIGGPTDVVVEQNIVRAGAARDAGRDLRTAAPGDTLPRAIPLADAGAWPLQPDPAQNGTPPSVQGSVQGSMQASASRPYRAAVTDEPWVAPEPARPRAEVPPPSPAPEFTARATHEFTPPARSAPPINPPMIREPAADSAPALPPQNDRNLAEMAQRLEAALRHPGSSEPHPPVNDPLAAGAARSSAPEPRVAMPARDAAREPRPMMPRPEAKPAAPAKSAYDNLEQEMANLLGRPSGKM